MHGLQDAYSFIETGKEPPERVYKEVKRLTDIEGENTGKES
jgi:hypothetical protein